MGTYNPQRWRAPKGLLSPTQEKHGQAPIVKNKLQTQFRGNSSPAHLIQRRESFFWSEASLTDTSLFFPAGDWDNAVSRKSAWHQRANRICWAGRSHFSWIGKTSGNVHYCCIYAQQKQHSWVSKSPWQRLSGEGYELMTDTWCVACAIMVGSQSQPLRWFNLRAYHGM